MPNIPVEAAGASGPATSVFAGADIPQDLEIELQMGFDEAVEYFRTDPIQPGTYEYVVASAKLTKVNKTGRPKIMVILKNVADRNAEPLFHHCPLPWMDTETKEYDDSGLFSLLNLCKAIGRKWTGTVLKPRELCNQMLGGTCRIKVSLVSNPEWDEGNPHNRIDKFV